MNEATRPQVVRTYLSQLGAALSGVSADVGRDILAGIAEELDGLTATEAATRIEELGDPLFIAAEARSAADREADTPSPEARTVDGSPSWYPVVTVLLIVAGGFVVPIVGWVVGLLMLWASPVWSDREKWAGTLTGPVATAAGVALCAAIIALARIISPTIFGMPLWSTLLLAAVVIPFIANVRVGIRLLRSAQNQS